MTRPAITYGDRTPVPVAYAGQDISTPTAGYFRHRLRSGAVYVGIHIWFGPPHDPVTGEEMDRGWRWQAQCNGRPIEIDSVWPECARTEITEAEYAYLTRLQAWGEAHAPNSPEANPRQKINWLTVPLNI